ncbi:MAG: hypothetical protein QW336_02490 [Candidatus Anstonellales archaeon]
MEKTSWVKMDIKAARKLLRDYGMEDYYDRLRENYRTNREIFEINPNQAASNIFNNLMRIHKYIVEKGKISQEDFKQIFQNVIKYLIKYRIDPRILYAYYTFESFEGSRDILDLVNQNDEELMDLLEKYTDLFRAYDTSGPSNRTLITYDKHAIPSIRSLLNNIHIFKDAVKIVTLDKIKNNLSESIRYKIANYIINENLEYNDIYSRILDTPDYLVKIMFRKPAFLKIPYNKYRLYTTRLQQLIHPDEVTDDDMVSRLYEAGFRHSLDPLIRSYLEGNDTLFNLKIKFKTVSKENDSWVEFLIALLQSKIGVVDVERIINEFTYGNHRTYAELFEKLKLNK